MGKSGTHCLGTYSFNRKVLGSEFAGPILVMLFEDNIVCVCTQAGRGTKEMVEGKGRGDPVSVTKRFCVFQTNQDNIVIHINPGIQ